MSSSTVPLSPYQDTSLPSVLLALADGMLNIDHTLRSFMHSTDQRLARLESRMDVVQHCILQHHAAFERRSEDRGAFPVPPRNVPPPPPPLPPSASSPWTVPSAHQQQETVATTTSELNLAVEDLERKLVTLRRLALGRSSASVDDTMEHGSNRHRTSMDGADVEPWTAAKALPRTPHQDRRREATTTKKRTWKAMTSSSSSSHSSSEDTSKGPTAHHSRWTSTTASSNVVSTSSVCSSRGRGESSDHPLEEEVVVSSSAHSQRLLIPPHGSGGAWQGLDRAQNGKKKKTTRKVKNVVGALTQRDEFIVAAH